MPRRVFFSFHYQNDVFRANQIRNSHIVQGTSAAGFRDASLWEAAKKKDDKAIKKMIDEGLRNTSVTIVLIGSETANRKYVNYEIEQSLARRNGLIGIFIHQLKDSNQLGSIKGLVPKMLLDNNASIYHWNSNQFGNWVETAYRNARQEKIGRSNSIFLRCLKLILFGG